MDTLRGEFDATETHSDADLPEERHGEPTPPPGIGQDERRMQVRAYNFWASLLEDRNFPSIEDLDPELQNDFGPNSVLLDFSSGVENPGVTYLGETLAGECGTQGMEIERLSDVPPRSLLSRITDHYLQIIANQAPIGFEAEFQNQRGTTILYRGILLPFSSDDDTIDFIYGVINWKEMADSRAADELLLEMDQAMEKASPLAEKSPRSLSDWMGGNHGALGSMEKEQEGDEDSFAENDLPRPSFAPEVADAAGTAGSDPDDWEPLDLTEDLEIGTEAPSLLGDESEAAYGEADWDNWEAEEATGPETAEVAEPADTRVTWDSQDDVPSFPASIAFSNDDERPIEDGEVGEFDPLGFDPSGKTASAEAEPPVDPVYSEDTPESDGSTVIETATFDPAAMDPADMGLGDWLAAAREQVEVASASEDRTRHALYEAIGRAWDFAIAAARDPQGFDELLEDAGIAQQERAPMTPVVKLVFGADYDKTRLTEYAAALMHAQRQRIGRGELAGFLAGAKGGLKGVVAAERRARRLQAGKPEVEQRQVPRSSIAKKLRKIDPVTIADIAPEGSEFGLVMIRRTESGEIEVLGEVPQDIGLIEKAARKLL